MHFYSVAELLEEAIREWCSTHDGAPLESHETSDLAFTLAEALLHRTELDIEPPTDELPGIGQPTT